VDGYAGTKESPHKVRFPAAPIHPPTVLRSYRILVCD
jgi:hypothetical protein